MKKKTKTIITIILLVTGINAALAEKGIEITSPDKQVSVLVFVTSEGRLSYSVKSNNIHVLETSPLGMVVDRIDLGCGAKIVAKPVRSKIDETYAIYGNHSIAINRCNEAAIPIETTGKSFQLIVRVYNDGVAIRYTLPEGSMSIDSDNTSWNLPKSIKKVA